MTGSAFDWPDPSDVPRDRPAHVPIWEMAVYNLEVMPGNLPWQPTLWRIKHSSCLVPIHTTILN